MGEAPVRTGMRQSAKGANKMGFSIHDVVVYGTNGTCEIVDICEKSFGGVRQDYYILRPVYDAKSTVFVPVGNPALCSRMKPLLQREEVDALIDALPEEESVWIEDEKLRREKYRAILECGNREELVKLIRTLYLHQQKQVRQGKKLHLADQRVFHNAQKMLHDELAFVLHIAPEEVGAFIEKRLEDHERTAQ